MNIELIQAVADDFPLTEGWRRAGRGQSGRTLGQPELGIGAR